MDNLNLTQRILLLVLCLTVNAMGQGARTSFPLYEKGITNYHEGWLFATNATGKILVRTADEPLEAVNYQQLTSAVAGVSVSTNGLIGSVTGPGMSTSGGAVTFSTNGWSFGSGSGDIHSLSNNVFNPVGFTNRFFHTVVVDNLVETGGVMRVTATNNSYGVVLRFDHFTNGLSAWTEAAPSTNWVANFVGATGGTTTITNPSAARTVSWPGMTDNGVVLVSVANTNLTTTLTVVTETNQFTVRAGAVPSVTEPWRINYHVVKTD